MDRENEPNPSARNLPPVACPVQADPDLIAQGWEPRHFIEPSRAEESITLYTSMGFEVMTQKLKMGDFSSACQACAISACNTFVMIYTRKPTTNHTKTPPAAPME